MATGVIRAVKSDGTYESAVHCHTLCKFSDPEYISNRDTGILSLYSFGGISSNRNYEVRNRTAPLTIFNVMAAVLAADTTIQFAPEAADYLEAGQLMVILNEQIEVVSVDAAGLATVIRGSNAADYTDENSAYIIGKPTNFCESANCYVNDGQRLIENSMYRSNYCVKTCKEELCENINYNPQCDDSSILNDEVDRLIAERAVMATRELNRIALHGQWKKWDSNTKGVSRGLLSTIQGVTADDGTVLSGILYDVADTADNSCANEVGGTDINGDNGLRILKEYVDRADLREGEHDIIIINTTVKHALRSAIYQCTDSCSVGSKGEAAVFATLDRIDMGTLGTLVVVEDNSMPNDKIAFARSSDLKWYGHCSSNGALQELKTITDTDGFMEKYETTIKIAFDATQNMCTSLGMIHGFTIAKPC